MPLPIKIPFPPMEAKLVQSIPTGENWQYEPKWDGFRCLTFRDGPQINLQSKAGQPLGRYFPEIVEAVCELKATKCVLDGEIVVPIGDSLSFDDLLQRIHPAQSRVLKLSKQTPALYMVFDLLANEKGESLIERELSDRRAALEKFAARYFTPASRIHLSPIAARLKQAEKWFAGGGTTLDGIVAKRLDCPYRSGLRDGMVKVKRQQTVECVVGGFRYGSRDTKTLGSLLLGLVEVQYDHFTGGRFRHGTRFLRWRPDKAAKACTMAQVETSSRPLALL